MILNENERDFLKKHLTTPTGCFFSKLLPWEQTCLSCEIANDTRISCSKCKNTEITAETTTMHPLRHQEKKWQRNHFVWWSKLILSLKKTCLNMTKILTESTTFRWKGSTCYKKLQTMKRGFSRGGINPRLRSSCRRQRNRSYYRSVVHVAN